MSSASLPPPVPPDEGPPPVRPPPATAPPTNTAPPPGFAAGAAPRSTPIPGDVPPPGAPGDAPYQPPPGAELADLSSRSSGSGRSRGGGVIVAAMIIGPVVLITVAVWAFLRGRDDSGRTQQTVDSVLADAPDASGPGSAVPPASLPADLTVPVEPTVAPSVAPEPPGVPPLFGPGGAPALVGVFETAIGASPARLLTLTISPAYAFAEAQDPANALHVDRYPFRDGVVGAREPVTLVGDDDLEANLFSTTDVDWSFLERAIAEAPSQAPSVEEGAVSHVIVSRSVFTDDLAVTVRVYVTGPRSSGYVEYTATGELIQVVV